MPKFLKNTHRSTSSGKTEIHTIHQIRYQEKAVDHRKNPADNLIESSIFFPMERQQKQQYKQGITIQNSRRIEDNTRPEHIQRIFPRQILTEQTEVLEQKGQTTERITHIDNEQIPYQGKHIRKQFFFHCQCFWKLRTAKLTIIF